MLKTLSYIRGNIEEIIIGGTYYFGQLWDGNGVGEELLHSGSIAIDNSVIVAFTIIEVNPEEIMDTIVKVTDIY